ncbi:hypothetical protein evm_012822 [Chilo suppressalis]|nr:hypothetical protein evm_012822 [Chilo suppressalis]
MDMERERRVLCIRANMLSRRADVIQTLTMVLVSMAFIIQATVKAGGPGKVIQDNIDGNRLQFFKFNWDPTVRVDTLSAIFGQMFMSVSIYGCQQTFVQRYCSMSSESRVRRTLLANVPAVGILFSLSWVVGMAIYSVYKNCDPLKAGSITAPDEVLAYYVQDQYAFLPGMLGLFLGSLFNGALSFLVSNVNSLATVTWEDFVSAAPSFKGTSDKQQLTVIKIIGIVYAVVIMCLSLAVGMTGGVVEGSLLVTSATSGALLGVFILAALCPAANGRSALAGMLAAHFLTVWMAAGRLLRVDTSVEMLPLSVAGCANETANVFHKPLPVSQNETLKQLAPILQALNTSRILPTESTIPSALQTFYSISYMWYAVIGTVTCVTIGVIVGLLTENDSDIYDERLLHPLVAKLARKMPGKPRKFLNENVEKPVEEKESSERTEEIVVEEVKPTIVFTTNSSRLFDVYETRKSPSPFPERTRL